MRVENTGRRLSLFREGRREPIVVQNAAANRRPYLHPLVAPDSVGFLTEDTPAHHPWQHGLYVGLNAVNGVGFWKEGKEDGTFHPEPIPPPQKKGDRVSWQVRTAWRSPDGTTLLTETQGWTFQDAGDTYTLDLDWQLRAEVALTFGESPYGGLFLRMPYREELGGLALNSEGLKNGDAEGQRARWVAVQMRTEGRSVPVGIALMDHPENPEHPVPWRVDGQLGIAPSRCIAGEWKLARGEMARFRHRAYAFCRPADVDRIEASWNAFAGGKA